MRISFTSCVFKHAVILSLAVMALSGRSFSNSDSGGPQSTRDAPCGSVSSFPPDLFYSSILHSLRHELLFCTNSGFPRVLVKCCISKQRGTSSRCPASGQTNQFVSFLDRNASDECGGSQGATPHMKGHSWGGFLSIGDLSTLM